MTLSDLLFVGAFLAGAVGAALLVGAFFGVIAAFGVALLVLSGALFVAAKGADST